MSLSTLSTQNKSRHWLSQYWFSLLIGLAALVIALAVMNFYRTHKKVSGPPLYQLTPSASNNSLYASQLLLQAQHKKVTVGQGETAHRELKTVWQQSEDEAKKTSVMLLTVSKEQEVDIPDMLDWVERGGHLITFSQDILKQENSDTKPNDKVEGSELTDYENNENALLTYLGIQNVSTNNVHDNHDFLAEHPASTTSVATHSASITPQEIQLHRKVLLKLPANPLAPQTSQGIGIVMSSSNVGQLNSEAFWQDYPDAKPIADYNWFNNPQQPQALTLVDASQWQTPPVNTAQLTKLQQAIAKEPSDFIPANKALLDIKLGEGRLTIANDNEIFTNPSPSFLESHRKDNKQSPTTAWEHITEFNYLPNVAANDNAHLLSYLVKDRETVWLVPDISVASLPTLLWRNLKWACIAFILCVIAALLALPKRFGRWERYQSDSQTNIFGYFNHVGEYVWQNDQAAALVEQNRERLLDKILAKYPQLVSHTHPSEQQGYVREIDRQQLCQVVSEDLGIGFASVALALFEPWQNEDQFLRISREFAFLNKKI